MDIWKDHPVRGWCWFLSIFAVLFAVAMLTGCGNMHERNEERRCQEGQTVSCPEVKEPVVEDDPEITKYGKMVILDLDEGGRLDVYQLDRARQCCGYEGVKHVFPVAVGYIVFECWGNR